MLHVRKPILKRRDHQDFDDTGRLALQSEEDMDRLRQNTPCHFIASPASYAPLHVSSTVPFGIQNSPMHLAFFSSSMESDKQPSSRRSSSWKKKQSCTPTWPDAFY